MLANRYGRSVRAKMTVSVGRDGRTAARITPMVPHTPLAHAHVHVGSDNGSCSSCGADQPPLTPGNAYGGPGSGGSTRRRPLGTTRATVTAGSTATFQFSTKVPFQVDCFDIPDDIAADFSLTSILFGLNQIITGGAINASSFNSRSGKNCVGCFDGCIIYPSVPAEVIARNNSAQDLPFEASFWGCALIGPC